MSLFYFLKMLFTLLLNVLILKPSFTEESTKLVLVQTLFRHGDRSPIFLYPNDPNNMDSWPEGMGKLTKIGKKQQYAVGKFLRSFYKEYVTSNPNEVSAFSSAAERTLSSALAHLAAFYAPEGIWKFEDLNWQPIPIYSLPTKIDKYLSFNSSCPRAGVEYEKLITSLPMSDLFQKYQTMMETLTNYTGLNISQGINALLLKDTLTIEKAYNLTIPEWADTYWNQLEEIEEITFRTILNSTIYLRLRVGPLLQRITETMMMKINGRIPDLKFQVFSAHDINVGGALLALNFTDMPKPPYCATLLFELHEMTDATMTVRLLYLNSTDPLKDMGKPRVLVLQECSEYCPIEIFIQKIQYVIPDNWEKECELVTADTSETE